MDERSENELVLRLTVEHLLSEGDWPELRYLHQRIAKDLKEDVEVRDVAKRLAPHPFFSRYTDLGEKFSPSLTVLATVPEADELIEGVVAFVAYARSKYLATSGPTEVRDKELVSELGLGREVVAALRELIHGVPFVTSGGGSNADGWYVGISDDITRWRAVETAEAFLARLGDIEGQRDDEYEAMRRAAARLADARGGLSAVQIDERFEPTDVDESGYIESEAFSLGTGTDPRGGSEKEGWQSSAMPELFDLEPTNLMEMILNLTVRGLGPSSHAASAYTAMFVRLVDKALREYEQARLLHDEFLRSKRQNLTAFFKACDQLDNCLGSTRRAIRHARRIRREREGQHVSSDEIPSEDDERRIVAFRNAAEHADERVADGSIPPGEPLMTVLHDRTFSLGPVEETYLWLADVLRKVHRLASRLAEGTES